LLARLLARSLVRPPSAPASPPLKSLSKCMKLHPSFLRVVPLIHPSILQSFNQSIKSRGFYVPLSSTCVWIVDRTLLLSGVFVSRHTSLTPIPTPPPTPTPVWYRCCRRLLFCTHPPNREELERTEARPVSINRSPRRRHVLIPLAALRSLHSLDEGRVGVLLVLVLFVVPSSVPVPASIRRRRLLLGNLLLQRLGVPVGGCGSWMYGWVGWSAWAWAWACARGGCVRAPTTDTHTHTKPERRRPLMHA
jgi:hypothetical protein